MTEAKNNQMSSRVLHQQGLATSVIDWLASIGYTNACVAGGAARDWKLGVPARDIDIFVVSEDDHDYCTIVDKIEEAYPSYKDLASEGSENYTANCNGIAKVFEFKQLEETVQLVLCWDSIQNNTDKKLWYNFPASTSKISWKAGVFDTDPEFDLSVTKKIVLFDNTRNNKKNDSYLNKTKKRFPRWPVFLRKRESLTLRIKKG